MQRDARTQLHPGNLQRGPRTIMKKLLLEISWHVPRRVIRVRGALDRELEGNFAIPSRFAGQKALLDTSLAPRNYYYFHTSQSLL